MMKSRDLKIKNQSSKFKFTLILLLLGTFLTVKAQQSITYTPNPLNFQSTDVGQFSGMELTPTSSDGASIYEITNITITGSNASEFDASGNNIPFYVDPEFPLPIMIGFGPTSAGNKTAVLTIVSNAPDSPHIINLSGSSEVALVPEISYNATIDFGGIDINTTTSQNLIIENKGNSPLTISNITMLEDYFDKTQFSLPTDLNLPIIVPAFSTADAISVSFSPEMTGAISGNNNRMARIEISSNDTSSPNIVNLQGAVLQPNLEINFLPEPYAFGDVNLGETSTQNITINNTGAGTLVVSNLSITPIVGSDFSHPEDYTLISPTTFPFNIAPNSSQDISIAFTPRDMGFRYARLSIETVNATNEIINITANGVNSNFTSSTSNLTFSELRVGQDETLSFSITNNGNRNLNLSSGIISGADASSFSIVSVNEIKTVGQGESNAVTVFVRYTPAESKTHQAKITYTSDAPNSPHEITLTGSAIDSDLQISTDNIDFGDVNIGLTKTQTITLSNTNGTDAVTIDDIRIRVSPDWLKFSLSEIDFPLIIDAGAETSFQVNFLSTSGGNKTAQIEIVSNDTNSPQSINLTGNTLTPGLLVSSPMLDFLDTQAVVQSRTKLFQITNDGDGDLLLTDMTINGANAADFQFEDITLPLTIAASNSKTVRVIFSPQTAGTRVATLTVKGDFVEDKIIGLLGKGNTPLISATNSGVFGQVRHNRTQTKVITLANSGTTDLVITEATITNTANAIFSLQDVTLPITISPGKTYDIEVLIDPTSTEIDRSSEANLQIVHNDTTKESLFTIALTATPTDFKIPTFTVASNLLELPTTEAGETSATNLPITNNGTGDLIITSGFWGIGSSGAMSLHTNTFPITIPAGSTSNIEISFSPLEGDTHQSRLQLVMNDTDFPYSLYHKSNTAEIIVTGGVSAPGFQVTNEEQNPITFLDTSLGRTSKQTIHITNVGTENLDIFKASADGNQGMFRITSSNFPQTNIAPGETVALTVTFTPTGEVGLKQENIIINTNIPRAPFFSTTSFEIPVAGLAVKAEEVIVGGMHFRADNLTIESDIATLEGNVSAGNSLEFDSVVTINLNTNEITGNGDIYVTNIPKIGPFGGEKVLLQKGAYSFVANIDIPEIDLTSDADTTNFVFEMVGIPLEITKIKILANGDGVELGGKIPLPAAVFGVDQGVNMEAIQISKTNGVNVTGSVGISPYIDIFGTFALKDANITFDTFTNSYSGAATVGFDLLGKEIGIGAEIEIINGGLNKVALEIEVTPGIPIAQTGFALSGGNGFISGLQEPPVSFGLGVDISPSVPGLTDAMRFNNMTIAYTIGTSLDASGGLQVLGADVAEAGLKMTSKSLSVAAYVDLFTIFVGNLDAKIENIGNQLFLEANAKLAVTIPQAPCFVCGPINSVLPFTVGEAEAHLDNFGMDATVDVLEILRMNVAMNQVGKVTLGANFISANDKLGKVAGKSQLKSASNLVFENDQIAQAKDHLEGQSLIIEAKKNLFAKSASSSALSDIPFSLTQSHENVIVRVEGTTSTPSYTLILPDGTEVTPENAESLGVFYSTFDAEKKAYYILKNTPVGTYYYRIDDADTYQFDVVTSEFAPQLSNININHNTTTNDILISWEDTDQDSDATIAFYYDTDDEGGDGLLIQSGISENDDTDQITWNANDLKNGTYYVYGRIDDGTNTATIVYATDTFTINNPSSVPTTTLVAEKFEDTIALSWTSVPEADQYIVYIDESALTLFSPSQGVGANTSFDFKDILPGRTYNFAVTALFDDGTELIESNLSNIETINFISAKSNNIPKIETEDLPAISTSMSEYPTKIEVSDPDTADVLSLTMIEFPEGMTLTGNMLNWFPTKDQKGKHQVILEVSDGNGGTDTKSYTVTVFEAPINTFLGTTNNLWSEASNWSFGTVPTTAENTMISAGVSAVVDEVANVNELIIDGTLIISPEYAITINDILTQNGTLTVQSNATHSGSLILKENYTGIEKVTYQRYVTSDWHLISSPVNMFEISNFKDIVDTNGNKYALSTYDNSLASNRYIYFTDETGSEDINLPSRYLLEGKGYSVKKSVAGTINFSGYLNTNFETNFTLSDNSSGVGNKWNLVGNPYTSSIALNDDADATNNLLTVNAGNLDPTRVAVYQWNAVTASYDIINHSDEVAKYAAPGQGFFVESVDGGAILSIPESIQKHQTANLFSKTTSTTPEIVLSISKENTTKSTKIKYLENTTTGLDPGYDAGVFSGESSSFSIFTELVSDNTGVPFALQCLPNTNLETMVIPVGVLSEANKTITISAESVNLPSGIYTYLEDTKTGAFINLNEEDYMLTTQTALEGAERFFLHTKSNALTTDNEVFSAVIKIYKKDNNTLRITGMYNEQSKIIVYDILGKEVFTTNFVAKGSNDIALPNLKSAVYIVSLISEKGTKTQKIIIE
ncbi:choice-of-anchor D domain-containing protein [Polaribacter litorisediminis]|uniref:choice-of-anchor D domain-containing protein n=1 Tax=Polaribacter litorisediminis TaxID=1908341 RepID=UPI001CBD543F|nr:choice-of-anchor D domain-containing protein [Polaribacter litorisediminis]UAM99807.1 choice-of-anchor D domain-containing protein [Polaribacter litorisediminis]